MGAYEQCRVWGPTPDLVNQKLHFHNIPREHTCTWKLEKYSSDSTSLILQKTLQSPGRLSLLAWVPPQTGNRTETKPQFLMTPHLGILSAVFLQLSDEKQVWKKIYWHQNVKKRISTWTHVHCSQGSYRKPIYTPYTWVCAEFYTKKINLRIWQLSEESWQKSRWHLFPMITHFILVSGQSQV